MQRPGVFEAGAAAGSQRGTEVREVAGARLWGLAAPQMAFPSPQRPWRAASSALHLRRVLWWVFRWIRGNQDPPVRDGGSILEIK